MSEDTERPQEQSTWGVGPYEGDASQDPDFERFDPELLAEGDTRNVVDQYRYWSMEAIVADLDAKLTNLVQKRSCDCSRR